jgi:hypothetical protein
MDALQTPVLLITYKRLDTTMRVLDRISAVRPVKLYIASNAPNPLSAGDDVKVNTVRNAIKEKINWPCKVVSLFRTEHLSAKHSISSAITWFFEQETEGIILEDDCLVDTSFFYFAQECLERYRNDERVMQIGASNFQQGRKWNESSFYFSRYNHIWGWASWKRAWQHFDLSLKSLDKQDFKRNVAEIFKRPQDKTYWSAMFDYVKSGNIDTWDYQWMFSMWAKKGSSIIPQVNLVENIGFGVDATNTLNPTKDILLLKAGAVYFPLKHPEHVSIEENADAITSDTFFHISKSYRRRHLKIIIASKLPPGLKRSLKKLLLKFKKPLN